MGLKNSEILQRSMLFHGLSEEDVSAALEYLRAEEKKYRKGTIILHAGTLTDRMGLVLEGSVTIENNDMWGNRTILSHVGKGQFFAETYAYLSGEPMLVDVVANENCRILFLRIGSLHRSFPLEDSWVMPFISNLLSISAYKNLVLSGRSFHTAPKTIRGRVMSYLNTVSLQKGSREFDIPFDRQQLADYLKDQKERIRTDGTLIPQSSCMNWPCRKPRKGMSCFLLSRHQKNVWRRSQL